MPVDRTSHRSRPAPYNVVSSREQRSSTYDDNDEEGTSTGNKNASDTANRASVFVVINVPGSSPLAGVYPHEDAILTDPGLAPHKKRAPFPVVIEAPNVDVGQAVLKLLSPQNIQTCYDGRHSDDVADNLDDAGILEVLDEMWELYPKIYRCTTKAPVGLHLTRRCAKAKPYHTFSTAFRDAISNGHLGKNPDSATPTPNASDSEDEEEDIDSGNSGPRRPSSPFVKLNVSLHALKRVEPYTQPPPLEDNAEPDEDPSPNGPPLAIGVLTSQPWKEVEDIQRMADGVHALTGILPNSPNSNRLLDYLTGSRAVVEFTRRVDNDDALHTLRTDVLHLAFDIYRFAKLIRSEYDGVQKEVGVLKSNVELKEQYRTQRAADKQREATRRHLSVMTILSRPASDRQRDHYRMRDILFQAISIFVDNENLEERIRDIIDEGGDAHSVEELLKKNGVTLRKEHLNYLYKLLSFWDSMEGPRANAFEILGI
ncbi:hypothetical protein BDZ89DRAFT_1148433 [Hymenopellis radicata]|nr:hypothetical protein BDZ89DRAFT_1148433 [Hymenopellis radicata]